MTTARFQARVRTGLAALLVAAASGVIAAPASAEEPIEPVAVFATGAGCEVRIGNHGSVTGQITSHGDVAIGMTTKVEGSVHAEADLTVGNRATHRGPGSVTYAGEANVTNNTATWTPTKVEARAPMTGPILPALNDLGDEVPEHVHAGDWIVGDNAVLDRGVHRVDGNVLLGNKVRGQVTIVATGRITIGNQASLNPYYEGLSLVSQADTGCEPAIRIGTNTTVGVVHAPAGGVTIGKGTNVDAVVAAGFATTNYAVIKGHTFAPLNHDEDDESGEGGDEDDEGTQGPAVELRVPRGSVALLPGPEGFTDLTVTTASPAVTGVTWETNGDTVKAAVEMSAVEGTSTVVVAGTGCTDTGCDQPWLMTVTLTVIGIAASAAGDLDGFPVPSPDRAAAAHEIGAGVAVMGDEVTIVLNDPAGGRADADAVATSVGAVVAGGFDDLGIYLLRWDTAQDIKARLDQVIGDVRVGSVEGNFLTSVETTNVPGYSDESAYGEDDTWHLDLINAPTSWQKATGKGVKIGIIDMAFVTPHLDLPKLIRNPEVGVGSYKPRHWDHANHVAGLACARDNGRDVIGVAHDCDLLSQSVYRLGVDRVSIGETRVRSVVTYSPDLFSQLKKLMEHDPRIINASIGYGPACEAIQRKDRDSDVTIPACSAEIKDEYREVMDKTYAEWEKGGGNVFVTLMKSAPDTLLVVSAGNAGLDFATNWWSTGAKKYELSNVLTVSSVDENAKLSYFSNFGENVDIAAPGGFQVGKNGEILEEPVRYDKAILSLSAFATTRQHGTSMAAPLVAGAAALVAELHPEWSGEQIATCLTLSSTRDVTDRNDRTPSEGMDGHQFQFDRDKHTIPLLDAAAAVNCPSSGTPSTATQIVSQLTDGVQGNHTSEMSAISADGRWVTYHSYASNLVADDTNGRADVFVWDRETGLTSRVSIDSDGTQANGASLFPAISADGRWITYTSEASNLVDGDTNGTADVFVWNRETGETDRVSVHSSGTQGNRTSEMSAISADGRWVTYHSYASNLVADDTNGTPDVFVWNRETGETDRVSVASDGTEAHSDGYSALRPAISADGRWISYHSRASNLVADDTNNYDDVFLWDRETGATRLVSVAFDGNPHRDGESVTPSISADGRWVTYSSNASNLVAGDANNTYDVFVWDRETGATRLVSVPFEENPRRDGGSRAPSISADGRWVTYVSSAKNLVPDDSSDTFPAVYEWDRSTGATRQVSKAFDGGSVNNSSWNPSISADGRWITFDSFASNLVANDLNNKTDVFLSGTGR